MKTWHINGCEADGTKVSLYMVDGRNEERLAGLERDDNGMWPEDRQPTEGVDHFQVRMAFANRLTALAMIELIVEAERLLEEAGQRPKFDLHELEVV